MPKPERTKYKIIGKKVKRTITPSDANTVPPLNILLLQNCSYLMWFVYGSYIPVSNIILIDKTIAPATNNPLPIILSSFLCDRKPREINNIANIIDISPKPIFTILFNTF
ncbi:hypothetical protein NX023_19930 [Cytobacillus firmus]|nr:hypothetical protein [Cytobacillus firmus]